MRSKGKNKSRVPRIVRNGDLLARSESIDKNQFSVESLTIFFQKILHKKYAIFADIFSPIIVKINHPKTPKRAPERNVKKVAGKKIIGRIA